MTSERDGIRREMRRQRRQLSRRERRERSAELLRRLTASPRFRRARHIALYLPNDGEVDLRPLLATAWARGKRCYLPVLSPAFHNRLWFTRYGAATPLVKNVFGIPEPERHWRKTRPLWSLDLVLAPLVAFDPAGNRLGMGGGFYDRSLAYLHRRRCWRKPQLLGVAFDFQRAPALPAAPWDVPLDGIITDCGFYEAQK